MAIVYDVKVRGKIIMNLKVVTESEETLENDVRNMLKDKGYEDIEIIEKKIGKLS